MGREISRYRLGMLVDTCDPVNNDDRGALVGGEIDPRLGEPGLDVDPKDGGRGRCNFRF